MATWKVGGGSGSGVFTKAASWDTGIVPGINDYATFDQQIPANRSFTGSFYLPGAIEISAASNDGIWLDTERYKNQYRWSVFASNGTYFLTNNVTHSIDIVEGAQLFFPSDKIWGGGSSTNPNSWPVSHIVKTGAGVLRIDRPGSQQWYGNLYINEGVLEAHASSNSIKFGTGLVVNANGTTRLNFGGGPYETTFTSPITFLGSGEARWTSYPASFMYVTYTGDIDVGSADLLYQGGHTTMKYNGNFNCPVKGNEDARIYFSGKLRGTASWDTMNEQRAYFYGAHTCDFKGEVYINKPAILNVRPDHELLKYARLDWSAPEQYEGSDDSSVGRLVSTGSATQALQIGSIEGYTDFPVPFNLIIGSDALRPDFTTGRLIRGLSEDKKLFRDGTIKKVGTGLWTIDGDNTTITGSFTVDNGALQVNYNSSWGPSTGGSVSISGNGTLIVNCDRPTSKTILFDSSPMTAYTSSALITKTDTTLDNFIWLYRNTTFLIDGETIFPRQMLATTNDITLYLTSSNSSNCIMSGSSGTSFVHSIQANNLGQLKIVGVNTGSSTSALYLGNNSSSLILEHTAAATSFSINQKGGDIYTETLTSMYINGFNSCSADVLTSNNNAQNVEILYSQNKGNGIFTGLFRDNGTLKVTGGEVYFSSSLPHERTGLTSISNTKLHIYNKDTLVSSSAIQVTSSLQVNISNTSDPVVLETKNLSFTGGKLILA